MAAPTPEELATLEKFREALSDLELNEKQRKEMFLLAWLRARDMNISKAKEMLKNNLAYRKHHDMDNILQWEPPEHIQKNFPYEICGKCKEGCPIVVINIGKWDIRTAVEAGDGQVWIRYFDKLLEEIRAFNDKSNSAKDPTGKDVPITQAVFIYDFEGFGMRQLTSIHSVRTILEFVSRYESNNPEILKRCYVINAHKVFSILFAIIKPVMSPHTISKVEINGAQSKWEPILLKEICRDQLPPKFGGTNPELCQFLTSKSTVPAADSEVHLEATIPAGKELTLEYDILTENTVLAWNFKLQDHDIGFSIFYNSIEEILPYKKVEKDVGRILCKKIGTYTFVFDNKYSQLRKKYIHYSISLSDSTDDAKTNGMA